MNTLIFLCFTLSLYPYHTVSLASTNVTAMQMRRALLSLKDMVSDPFGSLHSWNSSNNPCRWRGVGCSRKHTERILELNLNSFGLIGGISPLLSNLSYLHVLNLGENHLAGQIPADRTGPLPADLGHLRRLRVLNLSMNSLQGGIPTSLAGCTNLMKLSLAHNQLRGEIPGEIGSLRNLVFFTLHTNYLTGNIPSSLGNLSSLVALSMAKNFLSGMIPTSFGNLSNLTIISLLNNQLSGAIPSSLGRLTNMVTLILDQNNLTGSIPPTIWNMSSLVLFSVETNELTGTVPPNALSKLSALEIFSLVENNFHGQIPSSLPNATGLIQFEIAINHFSGTIPPKLGGLQGLQFFVLAFNAFEAKNHHEWNFMHALTNCSELQALELNDNKLSGTFPSAASNLSTKLPYLSLAGNTISGHVPREIGNLVGLSGIIPSTIGNMVSLLILDLSTNHFTGTIPSSLFNITTLSIQLGISNNHFEGPIPPEIGNLQNLVVFDAMFNRLTGEIPATLGKCQLLQTINLQNNSLAGNIPSLLSGLKGLEILNLSRNNFSGQIPNFLGDFTSLAHLDLSFNNFDGEVPKVGVFANATKIWVVGNSKLCGGFQDLHLPPCSLQILKRKHKIPVLAIVLSLVATTICILLLLMFFLDYYKRKSRETPSTMSTQGHKVVSYQQLVEATNGFSTLNLLGSGSYGSVYRANLHDDISGQENIVALKVLKLHTPGALKSFTSECEAMRNLRHRNLVKVITACSSIDFNGNDFKAIVLDFMPNGNLEEWLHPFTNHQPGARNLSLAQRMSILFDVANALEYLHCNGGAPIVHCDLKPSNVLLDSDMLAHVGDFGLSRILIEGCSYFQASTNSMGFRGTIGYAPPEYGAGNMVSTHGDIYSYGVLILEMVTARRPTDNMFDQGLNLRKYVKIAFESRMMDIVDPELAEELENGPATTDGPSNQRKVDALISLVKLGMLCSEEIPSSRISTKDIIRELHAIKVKEIKENK
ncbi:receptor kinase-like protein Xa21 [Triticum aestivum]|uniref:receptor kinase-like protein Xa21 n=1 Tax=Triticum aestivum TaxID=4565 RepID=UPI001D01D30C|nr:receptor kinase-like protein Xa21 [Triticum aestivum]